MLSGVVSAFAGIYYTLRFGSARGDNATGLELQVIAAVLLGGVSIFGGRGRLHGVIAGVVLIGVISSALRLEGVTVNVINIIIGLLLVASVIVHQRPVVVGRHPAPTQGSSVRGARPPQAGHTGRRLKRRERLDGMKLHSNRATALAALRAQLSRS